MPAEEFALAHTLDVVSDVHFECERIIKGGDDVVMPLLWARNVEKAELEDAFADDPSVDNVRQLAEFDDELLYRMDWVARVELLLNMITNSEATILDAYGKHDKWNLRVMFPTRDRFSMTHEFCEDHGLTYDVDSIREMEGKPAARFGLTDEQYQALVFATKEGYYSVPQERTLNELADQLDITHQALSERLHRAIDSLVEDTLIVGTDST